MICFKCGHDNPATAVNCEKCKTPLPKMPAGYQAPKPVLTERLQKFRDAINNLKNNIWTAEEFKSFLDNISADLAARFADIKSTDVPVEMEEDFAEEMALGLEGITLYEQGINELYATLQDGNIDHLDIGFEIIEEGNDKINEAMRINRENRQKMEELYNPDWGPI
ncbi:MAG: hypothetical protein ABIH00_05785 [Armatimonadota bacterium]